MKPKQSANILSELPEEDQKEITYRLATMEKTSPDEKYIKLIKFIRESATNSKDNSNK